ncbi:MAG: DUF1232 domain-containing protein [Chloroflexota bacterium]
MANKNSTTSTSAADQLKDPNFLQELWQQIKLVYYLLRDGNVPIYMKLLPFVGIAYVLFPLDFIPDVIPGLGQLDDLTILIVGLKVFIEMAPADIVTYYLDLMRGKARVVDGESTTVKVDPKELKETVVIDPDPVDLKAQENE